VHVFQSSATTTEFRYLGCFGISCSKRGSFDHGRGAACWIRRQSEDTQRTKRDIHPVVTFDGWRVGHATEMVCPESITRLSIKAVEVATAGREHERGANLCGESRLGGMPNSLAPRQGAGECCGRLPVGVHSTVARRSHHHAVADAEGFQLRAVGVKRHLHHPVEMPAAGSRKVFSNADVTTVGERS
jgi:hypothetical protein